MREFFNPWCLLSVGLFALNNHYLKWQFHNWLTGKLSDITICFFLPLLIAALLEPLVKLDVERRFWVGAIVTALALTSVKVSETASNLLNQTLSAITQSVGLNPSINSVDPTDLLGLLAIPLAYYAVVMPLKKETIS